MNRLIDRIQRFVQELRRRRVFRVAVVYAGTAFIVLQVCALMFPALRLPEWTMTLVVVLLIAGAPITLIAAWAFEITPEGVVRTAEREAPDTKTAPGHKRGSCNGRLSSGVSTERRKGSSFSGAQASSLRIHGIRSNLNRIRTGSEQGRGNPRGRASPTSSRSRAGPCATC